MQPRVSILCYEGLFLWLNKTKWRLITTTGNSQANWFLIKQQLNSGTYANNIRESTKNLTNKQNQLWYCINKILLIPISNAHKVHTLCIWCVKLIKFEAQWPTLLLKQLCVTVQTDFQTRHELCPDFLPVCSASGHSVTLTWT